MKSERYALTVRCAQAPRVLPSAQNPRLAPKSMDGQCQPAPSQYLNSMKSNLHLQERPRQIWSETPPKSQNSPRILGAPILNRPGSGSRTAKLLDRLDYLSQTREHLHRTRISTPAYHRLPQIPRYVFVGDQPGESEIRLGIFAGLRGTTMRDPKQLRTSLLIRSPPLC